MGEGRKLMKSVARMELKPGMVLAEDVLWQDEVLISAGTVLTHKHIERMVRHSIMIVTIMEEIDLATTHFQKLRFSEEFNAFEQKHTQNLILFKKLITDLATRGTAIPEQDLLNIYNDMRMTYSNGYVLLDYLYNLMPNEDELTFNHCLNSALLAGAFAEWISMQQAGKMDLILSGFYYDIGKLQIPYTLLWRPGKLTPEEFEIVKKHPVIGYVMLKDTGISQNVLGAVLMHHERMDGSGYPRRLTGEQISVFARYIAIVDTYIAMASPRPHRAALTPVDEVESAPHFSYRQLILRGPLCSAVI